MIRSASPGPEIYYLFHKEPVRGLISKYPPPPAPPPRRLNGAWPSRNVGPPLGLFCDVTGILFKWLLGEKNATQDPLPHTSLYQLHVAPWVCFIDYDPSVGNMGAVAGTRPNTRADTGNSANVVSILGQHLHSWHNIVCTGTLWLVNATRIYE